MAAREIHVGDIGTNFRITLKDDLAIVDASGATTQELIFKPPRLPSFARTTSYVIDGTDGQIEYATVDGDLSVKGVWKLQAHIVLAAGEWRSDVYEFPVHENL